MKIILRKNALHENLVDEKKVNYGTYTSNDLYALGIYYSFSYLYKQGSFMLGGGMKGAFTPPP